LIVPADAIPSWVYAVDTSTGCKSGYEERIFLFGQPMTACCGVSYSRESANLYKYAFGCLSEHIGYSQIAPYEQVVSTTMHLDDGYCTSYMQACIWEGVPLSECFQQPIEVVIG